jgi:hypothetical protein
MEIDPFDFNVMLCYVMLCYVMLCYVMLCYVINDCHLNYMKITIVYILHSFPVSPDHPKDTCRHHFNVDYIINKILRNNVLSLFQFPFERWRTPSLPN